MAEEKTIWSVGGGKGGVGKSIATANIGCALALKGKDVILVDADLGGANLHTYFGIKYPPNGLEDFIKGRSSSLEDAAIETPQKGLLLISGGGEFLGIANPAHAQKQKLISAIRRLKADYIIVDLGAGSSYNVLDFFAVSNEGIVVLAPEPAAIQNAYVFLKGFVYRRITRLFSDNAIISGLIKEVTDPRGKESVKSFSDLCERLSREDRDAARMALSVVLAYRPKLLLNMAASKDDLRVVDAFKGAAKTFLSLETDFIGVLYSRKEVKAAARKMRPFMLDETAIEAHRDMEAIVSGLLAPAALKYKEEEAEAPALPAAPPEERPSIETFEGRSREEDFGFNDNVSHMGTVFHVQTEARSGVRPQIETVIYQGGRIFFAKKTPWDDVLKAGGLDNDIRAFASRQHRTAIAAIKMNKISIEGLSK
ncbi:MAG: P-loop NTPase [Deltaproteobacteria bacterium]|nr:P-loop NTPase [Deltaproteobacteria bacterium]